MTKTNKNIEFITKKASPFFCTTSQMTREKKLYVASAIYLMILGITWAALLFTYTDHDPTVAYIVGILEVLLAIASFAILIAILMTNGHFPPSIGWSLMAGMAVALISGGFAVAHLFAETRNDKVWLRRFGIFMHILAIAPLIVILVAMNSLTGPPSTATEIKDAMAKKNSLEGTEG